jgi:hypothetical protein
MRLILSAALAPAVARALRADDGRHEPLLVPRGRAGGRDHENRRGGGRCPRLRGKPAERGLALSSFHQSLTDEELK